MGFDLHYTGDLSITVEAKLKIGTTASMTLEMSKIRGTVVLVIRRHPDEHMSFSFLRQPDLEFHLRMEFGDRNLNMIANTVAKRIRLIINRRLVYPNGLVYFLQKSLNPAPQKPRPGLEKPGSLAVTVVEASGLPGMSGSRPADPVCQLTLEKVKVRTKAISKSFTPVWDETFYFDLQVCGPGAEIEAAIFDKNTFTKDEPMGSVRIPVSKMPVNVITRKTFQLVLSQTAQAKASQFQSATVTLEFLVLDPTVEIFWGRQTTVADVLQAMKARTSTVGGDFVHVDPSMSSGSGGGGRGSKSEDLAAAALATVVVANSRVEPQGAEPITGDLNELHHALDGFADGGFALLRSYALRHLPSSDLPTEYVELEILYHIFALEVRRLSEHGPSAAGANGASRLDLRRAREDTAYLKDQLRRIWFGGSGLHSHDLLDPAVAAAAATATAMAMAPLVAGGEGARQGVISTPELRLSHIRTTSRPSSDGPPLLFSPSPSSPTGKTALCVATRESYPCRFFSVPGELLVWLDSVCFHFHEVAVYLYREEGPLAQLRTEAILSQVSWFVLSRYALTAYDRKGVGIYPDMVIPLDEVVHTKHEPGADRHQGYIRLTLSSGKKIYLGRAEEGQPLVAWFQKIQCAVLVAKYMHDQPASVNCLQMAYQHIVNIARVGDSLDITYRDRPLHSEDHEHSNRAPRDTWRPTVLPFRTAINTEAAFVTLETAWKSWTPAPTPGAVGIGFSPCSGRLAGELLELRDPFFQVFRVRVVSPVKEYACHLVQKISHFGSLCLCNEYLGFHGKKARHMVLTRMENLISVRVEKHLFKHQLVLDTALGERLHFLFDEEDNRIECMDFIDLCIRSRPERQ